MSEVKILNKEAFIQQYVLARANTINDGRIPDINLIISMGKEAYDDIRTLCGKDVNDTSNNRN